MMLLQTALDKLAEGDVFGFAVAVFAGKMPIPILALLVFGSIGTGYYMVQRSFIIPFVMFLLVGGVTVAQVPLQVQSGLIGVLVLALAGIGYLLLQRVEV
jgi:hypothetical protein